MADGSSSSSNSESEYEATAGPSTMPDSLDRLKSPVLSSYDYIETSVISTITNTFY